MNSKLSSSTRFEHFCTEFGLRALRLGTGGQIAGRGIGGGAAQFEQMRLAEADVLVGVRDGDARLAERDAVRELEVGAARDLVVLLLRELHDRVHVRPDGRLLLAARTRPEKPRSLRLNNLTELIGLRVSEWAPVRVVGRRYCAAGDDLHAGIRREVGSLPFFAVVVANAVRVLPFESIAVHSCIRTELALPERH